MALESKSIGFDPARLIQTHQAGIWRYLRALGCSPDEADDLTQDTFVGLLQRPFQELSDAATAAYLRKAAYHRFISSRRRLGREILTEQIEAISEWYTRFVGQDQGEEALEALQHCLRRLTQRAQRALELRYRDELPRLEIAETLEITDHGVRNLLQRAKSQLKDCVQSKLNHE